MNLYLKDHERSPRGLGWEYRRQGKPLISNPYQDGSEKHKEFTHGWKHFKQPKITAP